MPYSIICHTSACCTATLESHEYCTLRRAHIDARDMLRAAAIPCLRPTMSDSNEPFHTSDDLTVASTTRTDTIKTLGRFCFMELPAELRVKIYNLLLISPEELEISPHEHTVSLDFTKRSCPSVAIVKTCRLVNQEATPILYSKNAFCVCLPMQMSDNFFIHNFRWSTIQQFTSISVTSKSIPPLVPATSSLTPPIPRRNSTQWNKPYFSTTGSAIIARFTPRDFRVSPLGPDTYHARSILNWISRKVMQAEMDAIQKELDYIMGIGADALGLDSDDEAGT